VRCTTDYSSAGASTSAWHHHLGHQAGRGRAGRAVFGGVWLLMNRTKLGKALTATA